MRGGEENQSDERDGEKEREGEVGGMRRTKASG